MTTEQTRFLFIDDEELVLRALRRALRREPHALFFTNDPEGAFRLVKEEQIDVVISDHSMPNLTGVEFFATLRRLHPDVIRVMMTGQGDRETTIRAINDGQVHRFIEKPWSNEELRTILGQLHVEVLVKWRDEHPPGEAPRPRHRSIQKDATGAVIIPGTEG